MIEFEQAKQKIEIEKYYEALDLLRIAEAKYGSLECISFHIGKAYFYAGQYDLAETYFDRTLKSQEINIRDYSKYYLSRIYFGRKDIFKALDTFLNLEQLDIYEGKILIELFYELSLFLQKNNYNGNYLKTIEIYEKYREFIPQEDVFLANKLLNEYELASKKIFLTSRPRSWLVILSNLCNLKCVMCYQEKTEFRHINSKIISLMLENLKFAEKIIWQGGEPLILPYFENLLKQACQYKHIHQIIITNFQEVTDGMLDLIGNNRIHLTVSIDGAAKKTYESIRKGASFEKLIANIKRLNDLNRDVFLQINFVVMRENYFEMQDILEFAHKYNFRMISFIKCAVAPWQTLNESFSRQETEVIKENMAKIYVQAEKYGIIIDNQLPVPTAANSENKDMKFDNKDEKGLYCHLPWYEMTVSYDDVVKSHCLCLATGAVKTENILSVDDIWNSETLLSTRNNILNSDKKLCSDVCLSLAADYKKPINF